MPIIGITVSRMVMGFIDFAMVSELGTAAQAAVSPATMYVFTFQCIGFGIGQAVQTFAAQADGRGERHMASAFTWQSIYVAVAMGLLVIPLIPASRELVEWIGVNAGHSAEVRALEIAYLEVGLWAIGPSAVCGGFMGFFNGVRRPRIGLITILISIAANIAGNYALIFGHWGFPAMGIRGAALATVGAWGIRAIALAAFYCSEPFHETYQTRTGFALSRVKLGRLLKIGLPSSLQMFVDISSWLIFLMVIMPVYGTAAMAASNISLQLMHLSFMPAVGMGFALCTLFGFSVGEKKLDEANAFVRTGLVLTMGYMGGIGLLFFFGRGFLVGLLSDDPEVIRVGSYLLIWAAIFQISDATAIVYSNALRGAGDTRWPACAVAMCCWGIFIGGGFLLSRLGPGLGPNGPWVMSVVYLTVLAVLLLARYRGGKWKEIELFAHTEDAEGSAAPAPPHLASASATAKSGE